MLVLLWKTQLLRRADIGMDEVYASGWESFQLITHGIQPARVAFDADRRRYSDLGGFDCRSSRSIFEVASRVPHRS